MFSVLIMFTSIFDHRQRHLKIELRRPKDALEKPDKEKLQVSNLVVSCKVTEKLW